MPVNFEQRDVSAPFGKFLTKRYTPDTYKGGIPYLLMGGFGCRDNDMHEHIMKATEETGARVITIGNPRTFRNPWKWRNHGAQLSRRAQSFLFGADAWKVEEAILVGISRSNIAAAIATEMVLDAVESRNRSIFQDEEQPNTLKKVAVLEGVTPAGYQREDNFFRLSGAFLGDAAKSALIPNPEDKSLNATDLATRFTSYWLSHPESFDEVREIAGNPTRRLLEEIAKRVKMGAVAAKNDIIFDYKDIESFYRELESRFGESVSRLVGMPGTHSINVTQTVPLLITALRHAAALAAV